MRIVIVAKKRKMFIIYDVIKHASQFSIVVNIIVQYIIL